MPKRSAARKLVRYSADGVPPPTAAELARLRAAADDPVDFSDIPEWTGKGRPVERDARGRPLEHPIGSIARAVLGQLGRQRMTRYRLWQEAKAHCPTLSESAVYDFLAGKRQIGLPYVEAIMRAAGLKISANKATAAAKPKKAKVSDKK